MTVMSYEHDASRFSECGEKSTRRTAYLKCEGSREWGITLLGSRDWSEGGREHNVRAATPEQLMIDQETNPMGSMAEQGVHCSG